MDFIQVIIFIVIGIVGGIISGMGMGGGTLLIPLLTIFTSLNQHSAQAVNLIAFIPTAVVALIFHIKNKLVEGKHVLLIAIPATVSSVLSAILSKAVDGKRLAVFFGIFLFALGIYQLVSSIVETVKSSKEKSKELNKSEKM